MELNAENIAFRRGYYIEEALDRGLNDLIEYQLAPSSPYIYAERNDLIVSNDIVGAELSKDENQNWYFVDIELSETAIKKLNQMCSESTSPYLIMYIKGVPFYMVLLNGPFDSNTLRWDFFDDQIEAELLFSNLKNCQS